MDVGSAPQLDNGTIGIRTPNYKFLHDLLKMVKKKKKKKLTKVNSSFGLGLILLENVFFLNITFLFQA